MNEQFEIVNFDETTPLKLKSIYLEQMDSHWHKGIELLLVLSGEATVICGGEIFRLQEDDLMLINEYSIHSLKSDEGCNLVSLQIDTQRFIGKSEKLFFECNSTTDNDKGRFYHLKRMIAELLKVNSSYNEYNVYYNHFIV